MVSSALAITSLVAASMPALPAARRNCRSSLLFSAANSSTALTARLRVAALWSLRNTSTGASEQSVLNMPSARAMELFSTSLLRDSASHFRLPSFMPLIICLETVTREMADCTPSVLFIFHIRRSMGSITP
ncbi:hypothetical protein D9M68_399530 [compost metagenome]